MPSRVVVRIRPLGDLADPEPDPVLRPSCFSGIEGTKGALGLTGNCDIFTAFGGTDGFYFGIHNLDKI